MPTEEDVAFVKKRLDAILNWLEAPSPYPVGILCKRSEFNKGLGYEYAKQQVFEILVKKEVE